MQVAVIPARGGSKRVSRKNIREFCGKPMIAWSIESAVKSKCFDQIIVSTDDDEIAKISLECGASIPFKRPSNISDDHTTFRPVMSHAVDWFERNGMKIDLACCIYATAPFLMHSDIEFGLNKIRKSNCDYAISVTDFSFPIQRALRINQKGNAEMYHPEHLDTRSQDLEVAYHDAGQFYWGKSNAWIKGTNIFSFSTLPIVLPRHRVLDIDTPEDWQRAELMFQTFQRA